MEAIREFKVGDRVRTTFGSAGVVSSCGGSESVGVVFCGGAYEWCCDPKLLQHIDEPVAMPKPDADGWIPHGGGDAPVMRGTRVEFRCRNGAVSTARYWGVGFWAHKASPLDVIAWRPVKAEEPSAGGPFEPDSLPAELPFVPHDGSMYECTPRTPLPKLERRPVPLLQWLRFDVGALAGDKHAIAPRVRLKPVKLEFKAFGVRPSDKPGIEAAPPVMSLPAPEKEPSSTKPSITGLGVVWSKRGAPLMGQVE